MTPPRVSAVIVSYNTREATLRAVASVLEHAALPLETWVADNASSDGSAEAIRQAYPAVRLIDMGANLGFGAANNRAIEESTAPLVLLLNSDAEVRPGAVECLVAALEARPDVAVAGPRTLNSDGTLQLSWGSDLTLISEWHRRRLLRRLARRHASSRASVEALGQRAHEPDWLSGSCLLLRREAFLQVGRFDEAFFLYEEDADLGRRLRRAGWRLLFCPAAEVVHHQGGSASLAHGRAQIEYHRSHLLYYAKHRNLLEQTALRAWLALRALAGWTRAAGAADAALRRRFWVAVLRLALGVAVRRRHVLR